MNLPNWLAHGRSLADNMIAMWWKYAEEILSQDRRISEANGY
jgi:hypothetical protein